MKSGIFDITKKEIEVGDLVSNIFTFHHSSGNSSDWFGTEIPYPVSEMYFECITGRVEFKKGSYCIELKNKKLIYFHELLDYVGEDILDWLYGKELIEFACESKFITDEEYEYYLNATEDNEDNIPEDIYNLLTSRFKAECNNRANSFIITEKLPREYIGKPIYFYDNRNIIEAVIYTVTYYKDRVNIHYTHSSGIGKHSAAIPLEDLNKNTTHSLYKEILLYKYKDQLKPNSEDL